MKRNGNKKDNRKDNRNEERYYEQYSDTAHNQSDTLTDRQFYWVDWCMGEVLDRIATELDQSGKYKGWDKSDIVDAINNVFDNEDIYTSNYYDEWYDEDENVVVENALDAILRIWWDYESIVESEYVVYQNEEQAKEWGIDLNETTPVGGGMYEFTGLKKYFEKLYRDPQKQNKPL